MIPQIYFDRVQSYFIGDEKKSWEWFKTPHPRFSMRTPLEMIKTGRELKVMNYIDKWMS